MSLLFLVSPAKSLDYSSPLSVKECGVPRFVDAAENLVNYAKKLSPLQLRELMDISEDLASLNHARFKAWQRDHSLEVGARPAVFAFDGDVYSGLDVTSLDKRSLNYLVKHLRILSGLYGLLGPIDAIHPYRLEMGTRLKTSLGKNLYEYWGERVTQAINQDLEEFKLKTVINLASEEYFGVVQPKGLKAKVITPVFEDFSSGKFKIVSFFAKKARGSMVRFCAQQKAKKADDLKGFNLDGYAYCPDVSDEHRWVFRRQTA